MEYFLTAGGITVHICDSEDHPEKCPEKPVIIFLHGYLETMYIWSEFTDMLKDRYRTIVIDIPGHGLTDSAPADEKGISINSMDFCADVVKGVLDKCKVNKAYIAGHSLGGYIANICCLKYPETFLKFVVFNSTPYQDIPEKAEDRQREIGVIRAGKIETLAYISIPKMYNPDNLRKCDDKIRETVELSETHFPEGIVASILGMMYREDAQKLYSEAPLPILHISGDTDAFLPLDLLNKMKKDFPKVKFVTIPGTGHNSFIENPEECYKQVCEFLC